MIHRKPQKSDIIYIDSCAIDSIIANNELNQFFYGNDVLIYVSPSIDKELQNPNTPKKTRYPMNMLGDIFQISYFTCDAFNYSQADIKIKNGIITILRGNAQHKKHKEDANHVFHTIINEGYFITVDERIINKRDEISSYLQNSNYGPVDFKEVVAFFKNYAATYSIFSIICLSGFNNTSVS